jgi:hypothetical protein
MDFIHRLVSQDQTKLRKLEIIDNIHVHKQGSITSHRPAYLGAHTHINPWSQSNTGGMQ